MHSLRLLGVILSLCVAAPITEKLLLFWVDGAGCPERSQTATLAELAAAARDGLSLCQYGRTAAPTQIACLADRWCSCLGSVSSLAAVRTVVLEHRSIERGVHTGSYCTSTAPPIGRVDVRMLVHTSNKPAHRTDVLMQGACMRRNPKTKHPSCQQRVFFEHIWKSGGSSMEAMAKLNQEATLVHESTRKLDWKSVATSNVTFLNHHGPMQSAFPLADPHWIFMTMLRDPMVQPVSQFIHHRRVQTLKAQIELSEGFLSWIQYPLWRHGLIGQGNYFIDNLATRWLCGVTCDATTLTQQHFDTAASNLRQFRHVLIMEDLDEIDRCRLHRLGWKVLKSRLPKGRVLSGTSNSQVNADSLTGNASSPLEQILGNADVRVALERVQHFDIKLYALAKQIGSAQRNADLDTECTQTSPVFSSNWTNHYNLRRRVHAKWGRAKERLRKDVAEAIINWVEIQLDSVSGGCPNHDPAPILSLVVLEEYPRMEHLHNHSLQLYKSAHARYQAAALNHEDMSVVSQHEELQLGEVIIDDALDQAFKNRLFTLMVESRIAFTENRESLKKLQLWRLDQLSTVCLSHVTRPYIY